MILKKYEDIEKGLLVPIEFKDLSFSPKRAFFVTNVPIGVERGNHAHYENRQLIICVKGEILVKLYDGKNETSSIIKEGESIFVDKLTWDSQKFMTGNDAIMVLCSNEYNIEDYIFDKIEYEKVMNKS